MALAPHDELIAMRELSQDAKPVSPLSLKASVIAECAKSQLTSRQSVFAPKTPKLAPRRTETITPRIAFQEPERPQTPDELDIGLPMIDADDFLGPPALDPPAQTDEEQAYRLPRAPTPERKAAAARRKALKRYLTASSVAGRKPQGGARARLRSLSRRLSIVSAASFASGSSETSGTNASSISRSRWRFWRNDSSDSESSDTEDSFIPPDPSYVLVLPTLDMQPSMLNKPFTSFEAPSLGAALDHLSRFWDERRQSEHAGGDLGCGTTSQPAAPQQAPIPVSSTAQRPLGNGAGWWLDIQCPTVQDMRLLRKHLPLHPLTIEDVLHQDPREKVERFDRLRYTFVVFRALDDSYFRWTSVSPTPTSSPSNSGSKVPLPGRSPTPDEKGLRSDSNLELKSASEKSLDPPGRARLEICEGVGGKEGLEGVGVGAVNLYVVIFADGIVTFHYEPLPKHTGRVLNKIQQYGMTRPINSHWIAYGLLDSIVDAFFPIVDYIEHEAKAVDDYLSDPTSIRDVRRSSKLKPPRERLMARPDDVRPQTKETFYSLQCLPIIPCLKPRAAVVRYEGRQMRESRVNTASEVLWSNFSDRRVLLRQLTETRKLVTAMSRLLTPKTDVVRSVRKRIRELPLPSERDINVYFGDLQDHILALHQSLTYYESILAHDQPAFAGILRVALERTKLSTDLNILRFYVVMLIVLPCQVAIGCFSLNVRVPYNGDAYKSGREPDGSAPPLVWFSIICGVVGLVTCIVIGSAIVILRKLNQHGRSHHFN